MEQYDGKKIHGHIPSNQNLPAPFPEVEKMNNIYYPVRHKQNVAQLITTGCCRFGTSDAKYDQFASSR